MKFDPKTKKLGFASDKEIDEFHSELSSVLRISMMVATGHLSDPQEAKVASQKRMRELRVLMRTLNTLRKTLPRKSFG